MMNQTMKELLNKDNTAARALHDVLHLDFCKPFHAFTIKGRFTVNQVIKAAAAEGYNAHNAIIAILTTGTKYCSNDINLATLTITGGVEIDYKTPYNYRGRRCYVDDYGTKARFEDARKQESITSFVICQKLENVSEPNPHPVNYAERFKVGNITKWCYQSGGPSFIGEIELTRTDDDGSRTRYNGHGLVIYKGHTPEYKTITEVIDKSGYIVNSKRDELKRRAEGLRREREKAAYIVTDNAAKIADLRKAAEAKRAAIIEELKNATTGAQISAIGHKIYFYNCLGGIFSDIERIETRDSNKEYKSTASFEKACADVLEHLNNI